MCFTISGVDIIQVDGQDVLKFALAYGFRNIQVSAVIVTRQLLWDLQVVYTSSFGNNCCEAHLLV